VARAALGPRARNVPGGMSSTAVLQGSSECATRSNVIAPRAHLLWYFHGTWATPLARYMVCTQANSEHVHGDRPADCHEMSASSTEEHARTRACVCVHARAHTRAHTRAHAPPPSAVAAPPPALLYGACH
jgi:hypothetical protein